MLNASWKLSELAPDEAALSVTASISETLLAAIATSPPTLRLLLSTYALAELSIRFVVTTPVAASDVPWPVKELPPEEDAVLSALARMTACSTAAMSTLAAVTVALST